ncbi:MAG: ABC transporter substrate-binding protein [Idiomarina sp.]|nr:ABC transporter substrate-binding protein [Idiomarina sp.]
MSQVTFQVNAQVNAQPEDEWQAHLDAARGQTVYFHAWGGSAEANRYLRWAAGELREHYDIRLRHVRVADISEAVTRLLAESRSDASASAVDLLWVNGKNFHALKEADVLLGDLSTQVPNSHLLDSQLPYTVDFGIPTDDYELPWGMGQFYLMYNRESAPELEPDGYLSPAALLDFAQGNPGTLSYPLPPDFHGTTFLKQLLIALSDNDPRLAEPYQVATGEALLTQLFAYLDQLHPLLWRDGRAFVGSAAEQQRLFADGRLLMAMSFNPGELVSAKARGSLAQSSEAVSLGPQAITNSHYLAIPRHASAPSAALVTMNFFLSPKAQQRKADPEYWGDPAVLKAEHLQTAPELRFESASEPHVSWNEVIEAAWRERYE